MIEGSNHLFAGFWSQKKSLSVLAEGSKNSPYLQFPLQKTFVLQCLHTASKKSGILSITYIHLIQSNFQIKEVGKI